MMTNLAIQRAERGLEWGRKRRRPDTPAEQKRSYLPSLGPVGTRLGSKYRAEITKTFVHVFDLSNFGNPE